MNPIDKPEKPSEEKSCNCRNSKCMKLYCQCFAAGQECNKSCRCTDCHNPKDGELSKLLKAPTTIINNKTASLDLSKNIKGCSCRKSFCIKKYCECFQDGQLCTQNCKCIECQNNESMTNRNVLINLKKNNSNNSNKLCSLYPIVLSQSAQHINSLINEENLLDIDDRELQEAIQNMAYKAEKAETEPLITAFINILKKIDNKENKPEKEESFKMEDPSQ